MVLRSYKINGSTSIEVSFVPLAPIQAPSSPCLTYVALERALSTPRFNAYRDRADADDLDCVARYMWDMALASAMWPAIHLAELTIRNAIFDFGERETSRRPLQYRQIRCWLDAGLLQQGEEKDVTDAIKRLSPGQRTPGHLVASLSFGFWVHLCNAPYEQGRKDGPRIWPAATGMFYRAPKAQKTREGIRRRLAQVNETRNTIAHHRPLWDRKPVKRLAEVIETVGWLNPAMAETIKCTSNLEAVFSAGTAPFRALAQQLMIPRP